MLKWFRDQWGFGRFRAKLPGIRLVMGDPPESTRNCGNNNAFPGTPCAPNTFPERLQQRSGNVFVALGVPGNVSRKLSGNVWDTFGCFSQFPVVSGGSPLQDKKPETLISNTGFLLNTYGSTDQGSTDVEHLAL
jgi:hypothetical protein